MGPGIQPEEIRAAAKTFKQKTAAPDGCTPRQLGRLPEEGLQCLASLMQAYEQILDFPESQACLETALLETESGGFRPIRLYRSMYRLWSKHRQEEVRTWAAG